MILSLQVIGSVHVQVDTATWQNVYNPIIFSRLIRELCEEAVENI